MPEWIKYTLGAVGVFGVFALLMGIGTALVESADRREREREKRAEQLERARTMLYDHLTVDEAQKIVWAWEEMTDEERAALPLERRVEMRQIREDLAKHKERWGRE
jgi:hypothetical protein